MKPKLVTSRTWFTIRVWKCKLCGWHSSSFGNRSRVDRVQLSRANVEVDRHFSEKHPGVSDLGMTEIGILRLEG